MCEPSVSTGKGINGNIVGRVALFEMYIGMTHPETREETV